ncbi:hypothetical protein [Pseudarthrobacter sp. S9]|uniref:hypothetical protein n=1 Tax=Pseudarthrobacter sp. S9 TaxID=3418421 RepID=UPI003CFEE6DC
MQSVAATVARARVLCDGGATRPLAWRLEQLRSLRRMLVERRADFADADTRRAFAERASSGALCFDVPAAQRPDTPELIYPPYSRTKHRIISAIVAPAGRRLRKG